MVHLRINERESNPNTYINFITALPNTNTAAGEEARQLLRALAAQVKPVMKAHGFTVNSFEEVSRMHACVLWDGSSRGPVKIVALQYEHNQVFAGRNWNNGETIGAPKD